MKIIMLGAPGAGKGTQAERIAKTYGIPQISTGDIFRKNIKEETELGKEVKKIIDAGELVPDSLVNALVVDRIGQPDCADGYILDGYPRTIPQAEAFRAELSSRGEKMDFALDVEVSDEFIVARMGGRRMCSGCGATYHVVSNPPKQEGVCDACGGQLYVRDDDKPEVVENRLSVYHKTTQPLIDFYKEEGIFHEVDGTKPIDEVFEAIRAILSV